MARLVRDTQGEHVADIERSAQEAVPIGRRKRNSCVEKGGLSLPSKRGDSAPASSLVSGQPRSRLGSP